MPILPIDSGRYGTKEMKDIFEEDRKLNYELIFESAVASAQAELSIIPKNAYKNIEEVVSSNKITVQRVKEWGNTNFNTLWLPWIWASSL